MSVNDTQTAPSTGLTPGPALLVRLLVGFWAVWWSVAVLADIFDVLQELGLLGDGWPFASGNYEFLLVMVDGFALPSVAVAFVYSAGIAWKLGITLLCWLAFASVLQNPAKAQPVYRALLPALAFFAAFLVFTELVIAYDVAPTHVRLFVATLLSLLAIELVSTRT